MKAKILFLLLIIFGIQELSAQTKNTLPCSDNVIIPSFFSGNDDGIPQPFTIQFPDSLPSYYYLRIFTRWGQPVFDSHDPQEGWNGRYWNIGNVLEDGVYAYWLFYEWKNETEMHDCRGSITCMGLQGIPDDIKDTAGCSIYVPNYYLPNSEVIYEATFVPVFACPPIKYEMWIFDRWGNVVFETTDYTKGWDGKVNESWAQIDTYVWRIKCVQQPGESEHVLNGKFSLIR